MGAVLHRRFHVGRDTVFDLEVSGLRFEDDFEIVVKLETRKPPPRLGGAQPLDRQRVPLGRQYGPGNRFGGWKPGYEEPHGIQQPALGLAFELMPQFVGPVQKGNVIGVFEISLADDACFAVRASPIVRDTEPFDPQNAHPAAREVIKRAASKAADTQHDAVVVICHRTRPSKLSHVAIVMAALQNGQLVMARAV